jgi:hypothetical protein
VRVIGHQEEGGRRVAAPFVGEDAVEAPEGVGPARLVERPAGERARLPQARADATAKQVGLRAGRSAPEPGRGPLPRCVDVVCERDGEAGAAPARRLDAESTAQALERRVERIERGAGRSEPAVLVACAVSLLDAGEVEERLRKLVAMRPLPPGDLLPGLSRVGDVVPKTELPGPDRVEDPAGLPLDRLRDQPGRSADSRSAVTRPEPSQRAASR